MAKCELPMNRVEWCHWVYWCSKTCLAFEKDPEERLFAIEDLTMIVLDQTSYRISKLCELALREAMQGHWDPAVRALAEERFDELRERRFVR